MTPADQKNEIHSVVIDAAKDAIAYLHAVVKGEEIATAERTDAATFLVTRCFWEVFNTEESATL